MVGGGGVWLVAVAVAVAVAIALALAVVVVVVVVRSDGVSDAGFSRFLVGVFVRICDIVGLGGRAIDSSW